MAAAELAQLQDLLRKARRDYDVLLTYAKKGASSRKIGGRGIRSRGADFSQNAAHIVQNLSRYSEASEELAFELKSASMLKDSLDRWLATLADHADNPLWYDRIADDSAGLIARLDSCVKAYVAIPRGLIRAQQASASALRCEKCGSHLYPSAKFCAQCGTSISAQISQAIASPTGSGEAVSLRAPSRKITPKSLLTTEAFPADVRFQKTWRPYQARVLSELEEHLDDNRLHVVAAPGSGKTVLGIEVLRRLNRPTLILSPTLAIRDQWVERLVNDFLPQGSKRPGWVSSDIRKPDLFTVATYQALHSLYTGTARESEEVEEEETVAEDADEGNAIDASLARSQAIELLTNTGLRTLVLDECHHLRNEWWKSLTATIDELDNPKIVALTATPPYDVPPVEAERYNQVCGPIDAEISVPELVLARNLCPHQDYVFLSLPLKIEDERIRAFRDDADAFVKYISSSNEFIDALLAHPWVHEPDKHVEEILADPAVLSGVAIFLNHIGRKPPTELLDVMGVSKKRLPVLDLEWVEILLTGCLYSEASIHLANFPVINEVEARLKRMGAVERRKVVLRDTTEIKKLLTWSPGKLNSILSIVRLESEALGPSLRLVILTDYICKGELPAGPEDLKPPSRIGVVPIFELLRRNNLPIRLGVLSGTLVVVPKTAEGSLLKTASDMGIEPDRISLAPLKHDENYSSVEIMGEERERIVQLITRLLHEGSITALVGTKSLLGEGWDAPSINSLVLASFVGSYMLSNQMRGRAIRVQPGNPTKTANVWHLVCIEETRVPSSDVAGGTTIRLGQDFETIARRFKAFLGVSFKEVTIENGIGRLNLAAPPYGPDKVNSINSEMAKRALDRERLANSWDEALRRGSEGVRLVEEIEVPKLLLPRGFVFSNTISVLFLQGVSLAALWITSAAQGVRSVGNPDVPWLYLLVVSAGAGIIMLPYTVKALWLFLKHGPVEGSMRQIGEALMRTLAHIGIIKTDVTKLGVIAGKGKSRGTVFCNLAGGTAIEKWAYLDALHEILDPIENPRYILVRKSVFRGFRPEDYHAVPEVIGSRKEHAEYFSKMWKKYVGSMKLVYTRTIEGRRILLRARQNSLSTSFQKRTERISVWK